MTVRRCRLARSRALAAALVVIASIGAGAAAAGDEPSYTLDDDPLRLGNRALEEGRLDDARARFAEAVAAGYRVAEAHRGLADVALRQGRLDDAEGEYRLAIAAGGEHAPEAQAGLGVLLLRRGRPLEARPLLERALAADGGSWLAQYGLARLDLAAGDLERAADRLERGRKRRGVAEGEDLYLHGRALLLLAGSDLAGAETSALRAMHLNPADPEHAELVARVYEQRGVPALAIQAYEQALAAPGATASAPLLHQLGNLYRAQQRFNDAHQTYLRAIAADSTYAPVLADLADLLSRADRHDTAARTYLRYLETADGDTSAWLGLAGSLQALRRYDEAAQAAAKARALDAASDEARLAFARAAIHGSDSVARDEAAAILLALPDSVVADATTLLSLAAWQGDRARIAAAESTLARAAAADSTLYQVPFQQGLLALRAGRTDDAIAAFGRALDLSPDTAAIHLNLGIALYQAGRLADAMPSLRRAADLDPGFTVARVMLAQTLAATGEIAAAEDEYRQALATAPRHAPALRGLGFCRLRQADYAGAARYYGDATAAEPDNADGWAGLGSARLGQGQLDAAAAAFDRARRIDPRNALLLSGAKLLEQARNTQKENEPR
ncbi:MAG TPA: tetratricopeptide repeat protein [Candidatus Krumholzibacteria bacterium]|nr:tetratricopeptide repeat protein [Candidatus Krumholzibacteria bacterium]HPD70559.1 tetratricopeptide repeat protein [Candidatus Krumholzibacteria bacterium]HRY39741.1 tetratricopeptide repeat protein [Candidatus Krumholzibacteria bacterium]